MSEFTEKELRNILCFFEQHKQDDYDDYQYRSITNKLKAMIDNYSVLNKCRHKEIIRGPYPRTNPPKKCDVCGEMYR